MHTPGPWHLSPNGRYVRYGNNAPHGANICDTNVFGGPPDEGAANTRLIAAAPVLLEQLQTAIAILESDWEGDQPSQACNEMRAAVAKAKGGKS